MARRMPTAAEYRNAQRVTGMRDVDIADVRDITRRGLKAPAPARKRGKVKSRSRIVTQAKPKATPKPNLPSATTKPSGPRDTGGRASNDPRSPAEIKEAQNLSKQRFYTGQKVKIGENGSVIADEAPKRGLSEQEQAAVKKAVGNTEGPKYNSPLLHALKNGHKKTADKRPHDSIQSVNPDTSQNAQHERIMSVLGKNQTGRNWAAGSVLSSAALTLLSGKTNKGENRFNKMLHLGNNKGARKAMLAAVAREVAKDVAPDAALGYGLGTLKDNISKRPFRRN